MKRVGALLCVFLLTAACTAPALRDAELDNFAPRKAEKDLLLGLRAYEDGDYRRSARLLRSAISGGLLLTYDKVAAHKHLAFIHCAQAREKACRDEFRKALELNPRLELTPAEAHHPKWGPTFYSLKSEMAEQAQRR